MDRKNVQYISLKITLAGLFRKLTKMQETKPKIGAPNGDWVFLQFLGCKTSTETTYPAAG